MNLENYINESQIMLTNNLNTKEDFFHEISNIARNNNIISCKTALIESLLERESKGPTGLLDGFAIPHAQSKVIKKPSIIIIKNSKKIFWESLDEQPVNIVICLLVPESEKGTLHIDFLSKISVLLMDDKFRNDFIKLNEKNNIYKLILSKL